MNNYTLSDVQFFKVMDKDTGQLISVEELTENNVLSTIHNVVEISESEYLGLKALSEADHNI